ncbi:hypothetical protein PSPO01_16527 [Paraphaeosphaeria sporulosa]
MSQQPLSQSVPPKARRAANNNYQKLSKTLYEKLTKLSLEYDTHIYFLAYRNGRFNGFVSTEETGQPWSPPDRDTLVSTSLSRLPIANTSEETLYPPPGLSRQAIVGASRISSIS